ncbi:hypothetical protein IPM65_04950 [Candidatus Roizmanbacteria bacterium]|nr:MAG: hypothetical protein IPM65_04950 [Candidatus Roizmanbacteria bacterium]
MSQFVGIDIGASFVKGAVFDLQTGSIHSIVKYPSPENNLTHSGSAPLRFEIDGKEYVALAKKIIDTFLSRHDNIEGIVFSTQMHGMILVDSENTPLSPFIGWQDERLLETNLKTGVTWMDEVHNRLIDIDTLQTGITLRSGLMGSTLFWLQQNNKLIPTSKALFLADFVAVSLTSGKACVDVTNACGSGLFNTKKGSWDKIICRALHIPLSVLPDVVPTGTSIGALNLNGKQIPVYVSVGDLQAAVLGSLVKPKTELSINIGTGSQISIIHDRFQSGNYDIRSFFDNSYLYTVTHLPAGRALNVIIALIKNFSKSVLKKNINDTEIWGNLLSSLHKKKNSEGLKANISFFKNNATSMQTGAFSSITEHNFTVENIFYAAITSMSHNYYQAFQRLPGHETIDQIICSGGVIRQIKELQDCIRKTFQKPLQMAQYEEETLVGLFIIARYCRHDFDTIKAASDSVKNQPIRFA